MAPKESEGDAEFISKKWVWVPSSSSSNEGEGYVSGWITKSNGEEVGEGESIVEVRLSSGELKSITNSSLSPLNPPRFDRAPDIASLPYLNEASVVHNLRLRFSEGEIYTYSSIFLVAINPYRSLPIYGPSAIALYRDSSSPTLEASRSGAAGPTLAPHIYAVAEKAWVQMREERESQSVLITGESGAGKTENTKKVIQYLASIASSTSTMTRSGSSLQTLHSRGISTRGLEKDETGLLEKQIIQANPILEAFGNAQTMRNNNSSRFGKFIRIFFSPSGLIAGAKINWYLLEKSRVTFRSSGERSFHIFYQVLAGCLADEKMRSEFQLTGVIDDYGYLNKSRREVDGVNDFDEWNALTSSLSVVGFSENEQTELIKVIAAVLHIGNIAVTGEGPSQALMPNPAQIEPVCHLLGLSPAEFSKAVLRPKVKAGREWVVQSRTKQQVEDELASLCKTVYEKTFGVVVETINRALDRPKDKSTFIGVLDIAGFEIFEVNSFEQLCINYTNEKLQQFFNHHMFVLEQEEYAREEIEWSYVDFGQDLQHTIDLIENSSVPIGILSCLDEECIMPKASDSTFLNKLTDTWAPSSPAIIPPPGASKFGTIRFNQGFTVQHYAGKVEYRTDGWLDKNKDPLNSNLTSVLSKSSNKFVASLFSEFSDGTAMSNEAAGGGGRRVKAGAFRTVAQRHQEQLKNLMEQLTATQPHFVRCIVPNRFKKPGKIDVPLVLDQLRCNGVLEGIRIARRGFPNRLPFFEFKQRYSILTPEVIGQGYMDGRVACQLMIKALDLDPELVKLGTTKVFFKTGVLAGVQDRLDAYLHDVFTKFQAAARMFTARRQLKKHLNREAAIRMIQQNARVYNGLRDWPWWKTFTLVQPLLVATRDNLELQKRNAELLYAKERAEREEKEKEALEQLRLQLEADKGRVEAELEEERNISIKNEEVHQRALFKFQQQVDSLKADLDVLGTELTNTQEAAASSAANSAKTEREYLELVDAVEALELEKSELKTKEVGYLEKVKFIASEVEVLEKSKSALTQTVAELQLNLKAKDNELSNSRTRISVVEAKLDQNQRDETERRSTDSTKTERMEKDLRAANDRATSASKALFDADSRTKALESELQRVEAELSTMRADRDSIHQVTALLEAKVASSIQELDSHKTISQRESAARVKLEKDLDDLRKAHGSAETKQAEAARSKEEEIKSLRSQISKLEGDMTKESQAASKSIEKASVELSDHKTQLSNLTREYDELRRKSALDLQSLSKAEEALASAQLQQTAADSEMASIRSHLSSTDIALTETRNAKELFEKKLLKAQKNCQDFEDSLIELEKEKGTWAVARAELLRQLEAETSKRQAAEAFGAQKDAEATAHQETLSRNERELEKMSNEYSAINAEVRDLRARQDKTIVQHIYVLEAAKRMTDRQLEDTKLELEQLKVHVRSMERAKARDSQDQALSIEREKRTARNHEAALKVSDDAKRAAERQLASTKSELDQLKIHVKSLEKIRATDEEKTRTRLLRQLMDGNENIENEISSQSQALRSHNSGNVARPTTARP